MIKKNKCNAICLCWGENARGIVSYKMPDAKNAREGSSFEDIPRLVSHLGFSFIFKMQVRVLEKEDGLW